MIPASSPYTAALLVVGLLAVLAGAWWLFRLLAGSPRPRKFPARPRPPSHGAWAGRVYTTSRHARDASSPAPRAVGRVYLVPPGSDAAGHILQPRPWAQPRRLGAVPAPVSRGGRGGHPQTWTATAAVNGGGLNETNVYERSWSR